MGENILRITKFFTVIALTSVFVAVSATASFSCTEHTQAEASEWLQERIEENWAENYDGFHLRPQCVDLVEYYYDYLIDEHYTINASGYLRHDLPEGWTFTDKPQVGDIAVWKPFHNVAGLYGHVAIVNDIWESGAVFTYGIDGRTGTPENRLSEPTTYIHPDFKGEEKKIQKTKNAKAEMTAKRKGLEK